MNRLKRFVIHLSLADLISSASMIQPSAVVSVKIANVQMESVQLFISS